MKFLIYCLEIYRTNKNITGKDLIRLFEQYNVMDYILSGYGALHTTGAMYIVDDIYRYIDYRKTSA
ncbi:MAG: DUF3791 domain-containing protein [Clostridiales Family XIII bacterium]|nr:DUF3791 domain-containing protein [Clostridiales Family XIII bacterium]